ALVLAAHRGTGDPKARALAMLGAAGALPLVCALASVVPLPPGPLYWLIRTAIPLAAPAAVLLAWAACTLAARAAHTGVIVSRAARALGATLIVASAGWL